MRNVVVFVLMLSGAPVSQANSRNTVLVRIVDIESMSPPLLFQARAVAESLLASAGVHVRWERGHALQSQCATDDAGTTIALRFTEKAPAGTSQGALAAAMPFAMDGIGIEIFLDRLRPMLGMVARPEILLGHVLAHEIGHKLLETNAHSSSGLMKAHWSRLDMVGMVFKPLEFTPEHAAQMRENLARGGCRLVAAAGSIVN